MRGINAVLWRGYTRGMPNERYNYVISGSGILETFDAKYLIAAGDIMVCPVGNAGAHKITNTSETEDLIYLDVDTNNTPDIAFYPIQISWV